MSNACLCECCYRVSQCVHALPEFLLTCLNSLPIDNSFDLLILQAFVDEKINVIQTLKFAFGRVEYNVGKGENAGYQHFLLVPQCFQKVSW